MPLNADKAELLDVACKRFGAQRERDCFDGIMRRGIGKYYESNPTMQERLMRAMQHAFVEFEKGRTGDNTLTFTDVQVRFRKAWIRSMKKADYDTHRASIPKPIVEVP